LSYARGDDATAQLLNGYLLSRDVDVRTDQALEAGEEWDVAIDRLIRESDAILLLVSPASLRSGAAMYEAGFALRHARDEPLRVIPILIDEVDPATVPLPIRRTAWVDARGLDAKALLERVDAALSAADEARAAP
jgi:hypothetical protein